MIRRIVDSVSLLINSESQCKMDMLISSDKNDHELENSFSNTIKSKVLQNVHNVNLCCSSSVAYNNTGSLFTCESSYPVDLKSENSKLILNTSSSSCYIQPKSQSAERPTKSSNDKDETILPSDSPSIRILSRSPSITDLCSTTTRLLPGGPSITHPRNRRVPNTKKKENRKSHGNNRRSCLTVTSISKGKEVEQICSPCNSDQDGTFSQADPMVMEIECQLLPFHRDLRALELKLPAKFSEKPYRNLLKQIASEYELLILSVGKNQSDDCLLIRKRGILRQKQEKQLEEDEEREKQIKKKKQEEAERLALEKETKLVKEESQTITKPGNHEMCCQAEFDDLGREVGHKRARRIRRNRERQKKQSAKNIPTKRDCSMQTVPEDYWHCLWCNQHIAPENQCGHEAMCRADVQQKRMEFELKARLKQRQLDQEMRKRQRLGLPPLKKPTSDRINNNNQNNKNIRRSAHSRSRTRQVLADKSNQNKNSTNSVCHLSATKSDLNCKLKTCTDQLEHLHPNDIEAMYKLMKNLCNEPKCNLLANSHPDSKSINHRNSRCSNCKLIYCFKHLPIGKHFKCPVIDSNQNNEQLDPNSSSIACGNDLFEKKEALKAALRERKACLKQLRERN